MKKLKIFERPKCPFLLPFPGEVDCPYLEIDMCDEIEINVCNGDAWCHNHIDRSLQGGE